MSQIAPTRMKTAALATSPIFRMSTLAPCFEGRVALPLEPRRSLHMSRSTSIALIYGDDNVADDVDTSVFMCILTGDDTVPFDHDRQPDHLVA